MAEDSMWQVTDAMITALNTIREKCNPTIEGCKKCPFFIGFRWSIMSECDDEVICIVHDDIPADWRLKEIRRQ